MENPNVRVAVNIRPLSTPERLVGCSDCISVTPDEPQVQIGAHSFTFDYVYGSTGSTPSRIFDDCVAPLVDALFHGYNASLLAYGQTGSGKTYTLGMNYNGECTNGIIPKVMQTIFRHVEETKGNAEYLIRVSFIEIFKEQVFDLLETVYTKGHGKRAPIQIRETANGGILLAGVTEPEVTSQEEMASYLLRGSVCRATASTNMNTHSSRSHAIFTISMVQKRIAGGGSHNDILSAKLHLVDLAGSERAKKTEADSMRLREGININRGLLALGNVISALGDGKKRKGGHVPYRDSKLTRLLQDSLGGNSKTVMIACASPADKNAKETLDTLNYANRARNIQNKAIVNRDPVAALKNQIEQLQIELLYVKGDSSTPFEQLQILKQKISSLETSNTDLQKQLQEHQVNTEYLTKQATDAQFERDKLLLKIESARDGIPWDEIDCDSNKDVDVLKSYKSRIQELEGDLLHGKRLNTSKRSEVDYLDLDAKSCLFPESDSKTAEVVDNFEDEEELEHCWFQEKLDNERKELEAEMKRVKQHYEKKVQDLEQENRNLQVAQLKKTQDAQAQLLLQKQKSDETAKKLQDEIHRIKTNKVQLQQKRKQESEQFRLWKASQEKEVLQLKKEGIRNEYEMHKLLSLNQRQKMVLRRKTEEASMATKRLKEVLKSRKTSRETYERQKEERLKMAKEVAELKDEASISLLSHCSQTIVSPGARNSRIYALENMLATSSSTIVSMASQLSEAEERERGKGRWNHVGSLADAKTMNNFLNLASSSRCHLWDKEVACREKDSEIRGLKEKIVSSFRQVEMEKRLMSKSFKRDSTSQDSTVTEDVEGHAYDLRPKGPRNSIAYYGSGDMDELLEDMDTSSSEDRSDLEEEEDEDYIEWLHSEDFQDEMERKCSNREPVLVDMKPTVTVGNVNLSDDASQGVMPALSDGTQRKPLAEIGNTTFEKDQLLLKLKARNEEDLDKDDVDPKSSLFPEAVDFQAMHCVRCDSTAGPSYACSCDFCSFMVHNHCIGSDATFDEKGNFICPVCAFSLAKRKLKGFMRKHPATHTHDNEPSDEQQQGADPHGKRRIAWSQREIDVLEEAVRYFQGQPSPGKPAGRLPWKLILKRGCFVFSTHRTPTDLKDKWRRLQKQKAFSGGTSTSENPGKKAGNEQYAQKKRRPVAWSQSEVNALKKWVGKFLGVPGKPLRRIPWQTILEMGGSEFDLHRRPTDLKDKWRGLGKQQGMFDLKKEQQLNSSVLRDKDEPSPNFLCECIKMSDMSGGIFCDR